jgi:ribosomal protein S18 acetylase RimI-like enzyme
MKISIRKASEKDFPAILALIKELADFEKSPEKVTNTVDLMLLEKDYFNCFVAETERNEIIGIALYFFAYYTWVGKSLYLEDIYVKKEFRRQKTGTELLKKIFEVAQKEQCKRVRWQVLDWNNNAIEMYRKAGAEIDSHWLNCTFDYEGIMNFDTGNDN